MQEQAWIVNIKNREHFLLKQNNDWLKQFISRLDYLPTKNKKVLQYKKVQVNGGYQKFCSILKNYTSDNGKKYHFIDDDKAIAQFIYEKFIFKNESPTLSDIFSEISNTETEIDFGDYSNQNDNLTWQGNTSQLCYIFKSMSRLSSNLVILNCTNVGISHFLFDNIKILRKQPKDNKALLYVLRKKKNKILSRINRPKF